MSLAEIEAEIPDIPNELPLRPTVGNAMGQRGLEGAIDDALNLNRMSGRRRALSRWWPPGRFPDASVISPDDDRRAGACAPLTPGVRQPVAASTDSGDASNGERSGGAIHYQRDFSGRTHQIRNRVGQGA